MAENELHSLSPCQICGERIAADHTVDVRRDAATGRRGLIHMECGRDGVSRALRLGRSGPARPGTWDSWAGEEGAQSLLHAFTEGPP